MGIKQMGPPQDLMLLLKESFDVKVFIETGTFLGGTAKWASSQFEKVITIEAAEKIFVETSAKFQLISNIEFLYGDSRDLLPQLVSELENPAILWLDGHWSGGETFGQDDECPLIQELISLQDSPLSHFVFIDDARLFLAPPPHPHNISAWPTIDVVLKGLLDINRDYYILVFEDVIVAVPEFAQAITANYCQEQATIVWNARQSPAPRSDVVKGLKTIVRGMRILSRGLFGTRKSKPNA